jgi:hypothetical protein
MRVTTLYLYAMFTLAALAGCAGTTPETAEPNDELVLLKEQAEESEKVIKRQETLIASQKKAREGCEEEISELEDKVAELKAKNKELEAEVEAAKKDVDEAWASINDILGEEPGSEEVEVVAKDDGYDEPEDDPAEEVYSYHGEKKSYQSYSSETYVSPYPSSSYQAAPKPPLPESRVFVPGYVDTPKKGSTLNVAISAKKVKKGIYFRLWVGKYEVELDGYADMAYVRMPSGKEVVATVLAPGEIAYVPVMDHGPYAVYGQQCQMTFDAVSGTSICVAKSDKKKYLTKISDASPGKQEVHLMYYDN